MAVGYMSVLGVLVRDCIILGEVIMCVVIMLVVEYLCVQSTVVTVFVGVCIYSPVCDCVPE